MNPTSMRENTDLIPGLAQFKDLAGIAMSCGVGRRRGSEPQLLWLRHRLAATALIRPLAWEPPYPTGVALKHIKKTKKERKKKPICYWHKKQTHRPREESEEPRNTPTYI